MKKKIEQFENLIGYQYKNKSLLTLALTHSSYANEKNHGKLANNERLEFLGDAVLELVSSEFIFENYKEMPEGKMTKLRASIVCEPTLALEKPRRWRYNRPRWILRLGALSVHPLRKEVKIRPLRCKMKILTP